MRSSTSSSSFSFALALHFLFLPLDPLLLQLDGKRHLRFGQGHVGPLCRVDHLLFLSRQVPFEHSFDPQFGPFEHESTAFHIVSGPFQDDFLGFFRKVIRTIHLLELLQFFFSVLQRIPRAFQHETCRFLQERTVDGQEIVHFLVNNPFAPLGRFEVHRHGRVEQFQVVIGNALLESAQFHRHFHVVQRLVDLFGIKPNQRFTLLDACPVFQRLDYIER